MQNAGTHIGGEILFTPKNKRRNWLGRRHYVTGWQGLVDLGPWRAFASRSAALEYARGGRF